MGDKRVRLHFTNVVALGATRLLESLLPEIVASKYNIAAVYGPSGGQLDIAKLFDSTTLLVKKRRYLPNPLSRLLECTLLGFQYSGNIPLIVFGDIPLRCRTSQTVFFQNALLLNGQESGSIFGNIKYRFARFIFKANIKYAANFIVQTESIKNLLIKSYPSLKGRVSVIGQPPPIWLIASKNTVQNGSNEIHRDLVLFYPADIYPHKNHKLLQGFDKREALPIAEIILTISENGHPYKFLPFIKCVGKLQAIEILHMYKKSDALLFLSHVESYGLPLVEAMWIGLPIICPDLPYARALCGDQAIYFESDNVDSLKQAIIKFNRLKNQGWRPDWGPSLKLLPSNWSEVANFILSISVD